MAKLQYISFEKSDVVFEQIDTLKKEYGFRTNTSLVRFLVNKEYKAIKNYLKSLQKS